MYHSWKGKLIFGNRYPPVSYTHLDVYKRQLLEIILDGTWNCCKEIYYEAIKKDPSIGLATVYRMVGTLEEIGVLTRSYRYCLPAREPESGQLGA